MVILLKPYGSVDWEKKVLGNFLEIVGPPEGKTFLTEQEIINIIENVDILQADVDIKVTEDILKKGKKLKAVVCTSIGVDNVDIIAANNYGIIVANNPEFCIVAVAEYAIALMFTLLRNTYLAIKEVKENNWGIRNNLVGNEIQGKSLGIIGFGKIGREIAKMASCFGMNIYAIKNTIRKEEKLERKYNLRYLGTSENLSYVFSQSDIIIITAPLTSKTENMINSEILKSIKEKSYIINVSRGGIVNEEALAKNLLSGKIAGAALDVLSIEPPSKDNPLLKLQNVLITPHIAWNTKEAKLKSQSTLINQVKDLINNNVPQYVVNVEVLPKWKERHKTV